MKLRLWEPQENNLEAKEIKKVLLEGLQDMDGITHHQSFLFTLKISGFKIMSCYHNDLLASYLGTKENERLVFKKYF